MTNNSSVQTLLNICCFIGIVGFLALIIAATCILYFRKNDEIIYNNFEMMPNTKEINFYPGDPNSYAEYVEPLQEVMRRNEDYTPKDNKIYCSERDKEEGEVCIISPPTFDGCRNHDWGFSISKPCFLMTYANDSSFNPQPYKNPAELLSNANVPEAFKSIIREEMEDREDGFDTELI